MHRILSILALAFTPALTFAQRDAKVPDPDPELERKTFIVAPGFEVSLYAADPLLAKPLQMNFDPAGRLWVSTSEVYPQIKPGEKANDKVIILEDTDGDGKADKTTVFADGLLIPTGIEPGDGGAYVANSTEVVHLSASKPGGKADKKRILLSGFGTEDTHHIIHTFRWGPDCNLYFNQSIYIHSHIETPHGVRRLNAGGIWKYRPETGELDVFARGWVNSWGHAFDKYGQSFVTDGAGGEGINHAIPGSYFLTSIGPHQQRILKGLNPGSPKFCGLEIISGRHFPDDWQGDCITNDFRGHRVCRFKLSPDGSTYASREQTEVIKSNHPAFRPIDVKMGPDGALYIADWYNPIIQHGEVDFRDPRRDKTHGRIWRVTAKGRPLVPKPKLVGATVPVLLERLKDPEDWTRLQAKRVLKEMGKDEVYTQLKQWSATVDKEEHFLEAAWLIDAFHTGEERVQLSVAAAKNPDVKRAGFRILTTRGEPGLDVAGWSEQVKNDHPRVRLEAVRSLVHVKTPDAVEAALGALDKPMDRVLDYALWLTVRELEPHWMPAFKEGKLTFGGDPKKLAFALNAVGTQDAVKPVVALIDSGKVAKENLNGLYLLLARIGGPAELGTVLKRAAAKDVAAAERDALVLAVEDAVRVRKVGRPPQLQVIRDLWSEGPAANAAVRLVGLWKAEEFRSDLEAAATAAKASPEIRAAIFESISLFRDDKAKKILAGFSTKEWKPELRRPAIAALATIDIPAASSQAAEFLASPDAKDDLTELYSAFISKKGGAAALAKALEGKKLSADVAKLGVRAIKSAAVQDAGVLEAALTKAGDLQAAKKPVTPDEVKSLVADMIKGDPARGEAIFRRKELQCMACHAYGGTGGQVGPDLTSIGASAQPDYLVESLLLPNKAVKEGYNAIRVVTADDKVFLGRALREGNGQLLLLTPEDKQITIPTADIVERSNTKSIMPEALTDPLTKQEFADLARFLSELGKVGPYAPSKARVVRRWQLIEGTPQNMGLARTTRLAAAAEPTNGFAWSPMYSKVSGDLPINELPKLVVWNGNDPLAVVRFQLDVTTAGAAKLRFNNAAGLTLFVDGKPVEPKAETPLDLKTGTVTVTVVVDRAKRTDDLRVELDDVAGSPARVAVVGGK
jgi:putative heme-binding domain-containing protein